MPKTVEAALERAGRKRGWKGKRLGRFIYGSMTNMQKRGEIEPWRKLTGR